MREDPGDVQAFELDLTLVAPKLRRAIVQRLSMVGGLALACAVGVQLFQAHGHPSASTWWATLFTAFVMLLIFGFTARRTIAQQLEVARSYRLALGRLALRRVATGAPTVELLSDEVTRIVETADALLVKTADDARLISIPKTLRGYAKARAILSTWRDIETPTASEKRTDAAKGIAISIGLVGSWIASAWAKQPALLVAIDLLLLGIVAWLTRAVLRSQNATRRWKATFVIVMAMYLASPIMGLVQLALERSR